MNNIQVMLINFTKHTIKICFSIITCLVVMSCVNDNEEDLIPVELSPSGTITYQANIRPIIQNACNECHSNPPRNGAPQSLINIEEVRLSVENRNLIGRINDQSAPMPPSGLLPVNTRELIQEWVDGGFINQ